MLTLESIPLLNCWSALEQGWALRFLDQNAGILHGGLELPRRSIANRSECSRAQATASLVISGQARIPDSARTVATLSRAQTTKAKQALPCTASSTNGL